MNPTWYLVDRRSGDIVNAVSTERPAGPDLSRFPHGENLEAVLNPPHEALEHYRYWRERP